MGLKLGNDGLCFHDLTYQLRFFCYPKRTDIFYTGGRHSTGSANIACFKRGARKGKDV